MTRWYCLLFLTTSLALPDTSPRIVSFSTPSENVLHEPFNLVLNISHPEHGVSDSTRPVDEPAGVVGFLLQIPKDWEIQRAYRISRGKLEELKRYKNLESYFQPESGYQLFGVSLLDLPSELDDMLWRIILTIVPRSVGSYSVKVISCSQYESQSGHAWKAADPPDFAGFRRLESEKFVEVATVSPPQYTGGQAVALRTSSDALRIDQLDFPVFISDRDFTVEFWLKTTSLDASVFSVADPRPGELEPSGVFLEVDAEGMPVLVAREGGSTDPLLADVIVADGSWHHLAIVHRADGRILRLVVDGSWVDSLHISRFPSVQPAALSLGMLNREGFVGMVDEFRVWQIARSVDEVRREMHRELQAVTGGLVGLFHFDELSGDVAANELKVGLPDMTLSGKAKFVASHSPAVREIFRLSVQLRRDQIELVWELSSVDGVARFAVERRSEGEPFEEVARVDVVSASAGAIPHVFTHLDNVSPDVGVVRYRIRQENLDGSMRYSDEVKVGTGTPVEFTLEQNHPNPFNPSTTIPYSIYVETEVRLKVYDLVGREVAVLVDQHQSPGTYAIEFDVENYKGLTSGIYFYKLETDRQSEIRKMILAK